MGGGTQPEGRGLSDVFRPLSRHTKQPFTHFPRLGVGQKEFLKTFRVAASETQVLSVHIFLVISQNECGKSLRQSTGRFPSVPISGKVSGSSSFSKTN